MEDYSDKTIRALIVEMINEDEKKSSTLAVLVNLDEKYKLPTKLLAAFSAIFTPAGFATLALVGLIVEKDVTLATAGAVGQTALNLRDAFRAGLSAKKGEKASTFFESFSVAQEQNTFNYINDVKNIAKSDDSITAEMITKIIESYNKNINAVDSGDSKADQEIYAAILNKNIDDVFTEGSFTVNEKNQFVMTGQGDYKLPLNAKIKKEIERSQKLAAAGDETQKERSKIAIKRAYTTYNAAIYIKNNPSSADATRAASVLDLVGDDEGFWKRVQNRMSGNKPLFQAFKEELGFGGDKKEEEAEVK